jgi:hypothetical protein
MARKVGQIIARGDCRWLIRVYLGRELEGQMSMQHSLDSTLKSPKNATKEQTAKQELIEAINRVSKDAAAITRRFW